MSMTTENEKPGPVRQPNGDARDADQLNDAASASTPKVTFDESAVTAPENGADRLVLRSGGSRPAQGLVEPEVDAAVIRQFAAMPDGVLLLREYAKALYCAANGIADINRPNEHPDNPRARHIEENIVRLRAAASNSKPTQVVYSQLLEKPDNFKGGMIVVTFGLMILGLFAMNMAAASYLINSGLFVDYLEQPWKAYIFCTLPLTAAFMPKAVAHDLDDRHRQRFGLALGVLGAIAGLAWIGFYATLFAPRAAAAALTLPGAGPASLEFAGVGLVVAHLVGEIAFAALLGLFAERLWYSSRAREVVPAPEFERYQADIQAAFDELRTIRAGQNAVQAGFKAFVLTLEGRFDNELKQLQASQAYAGVTHAAGRSVNGSATE